ncbi:MAG: hypothetical protein C0501_20490 [Isosphaera sp.]|nr:hypothetical protein [Isosphaera sp.]
MAHDTPETAAAGLDPARERLLLRAQCAKLRHWCRGLLDEADGTDGVLAADVERELRATPPEMSLDEVWAVLRAVTQGEPLPPHPPASADVPGLAAERQRLAAEFFKLHDAAFPDDAPFTDEYFAELADQPGSSETISEILARLEREHDGGR